MPGRFAEGPRHPGFILPASAVSEQENREIPRETELLFFVAAQKFVAFDGGNHSDGDRHVLVVDKARCRLYELYRGFFKRRPRPHWNADSATNWDLRSAAWIGAAST